MDIHKELERQADAMLDGKLVIPQNSEVIANAAKEKAAADAKLAETAENAVEQDKLFEAVKTAAINYNPSDTREFEKTISEYFFSMGVNNGTQSKKLYGFLINPDTGKPFSTGKEFVEQRLKMAGVQEYLGFADVQNRIQKYFNHKAAGGGSKAGKWGENGEETKKIRKERDDARQATADLAKTAEEDGRTIMAELQKSQVAMTAQEETIDRLVAERNSLLAERDAAIARISELEAIVNEQQAYIASLTAKRTKKAKAA